MNFTSKKQCSNPIYFDNNGTTLPCAPSVKAHASWLSCYNASSDSKISLPAKQMIEKATDAILSHCGVSTATHTALFTSGGTESNCFIIRACVKAYKKKLIARESELLPHVIVSAVEHHSIMACVKDLEESKEITVTYIAPTIYGNILPEDVEKAIKSNTCIIAIMYANNEVPIINNIREIGEVAHTFKVPLHSDCVQIFGKYKINLVKDNIDSISLSAHKFYGPKGVGALIVNNALLEGYAITAEINGTQQHSLRGGTENVAGIASMMAALQWAFSNRQKKNAKLYALREHTLELLAKEFKFGDFATYALDTPPNAEEEMPDLELLSLGPPEDKKSFILPNTILLSICKNKGKPFCNIELKKFLDSKNCVVSIGSACHTKSDKASHVLFAIGAPPVVRRGVLRISFGDNNTMQEVNEFIKLLITGIKKQLADLKE